MEPGKHWQLMDFKFFDQVPIKIEPENLLELSVMHDEDILYKKIIGNPLHLSRALPLFEIVADKSAVRVELEELLMILDKNRAIGGNLWISGIPEIILPTHIVDPHQFDQFLHPAGIPAGWFFRVFDNGLGC